MRITLTCRTGAGGLLYAAYIPEALPLNANGDPGVGLGIAAPGQTLDGQLVVAGTEGGAVQCNAQMTVGVLGELADDGYASLVDAIDGDAEDLVGRAGLVD